MDNLFSLLLLLIVVGIVWGIIKAIFKLTMKVFSCGLFFILVIGAIVYVLTNA
ncbi:MAG: hypothetical protein HN413_05465 [Chloroflexi bacterium]|jgi:hypothetical protein|nr:hypothetical protein [Chloroflexota bacterium]